MLQVAIVGFPNAGKSTLFNRLLRQKKSLVHSLPGMTRDRVASLYVLHGKQLELVDTGGFFDSQAELLSAKVKQIAWEAAQKADKSGVIAWGARSVAIGGNAQNNIIITGDNSQVQR